MIERAKSALDVKSDTDFARALGVTPSTIGGYRRRNNTVPLEQCIKIAEQTDVSLDWLILGKGGIHYSAPLEKFGSTLLRLYGSDEYLLVPTEFLNHVAPDIKPIDLNIFITRSDAMQPSINPDDFILVNTARRHGDGVFLLNIGNMPQIKRLQWLADGRLRISSDNPIYETEYVAPEDLADDFAVIGFCHTKIGRVD